ncbi:MAG: phage-type endonuclease [Pseudonocardia sp.]|nr:phage-type endonuclease [Pseudonocardia sp.]
MTAAYIRVLPYRAPRDVWLQARRHGIGGSDIAAICGLSTWASPYSVFADKLGLTPADSEETERQRWGNLLEPVIGAEWARRHPGARIRRVGMVRSKTRPWQQCSPDFLTDCCGGRRGHLQAKTADRYMADEWDEDSVPLPYLLQGTHEADVLGVDHFHFATLLGGNELVDYVVEHDDGLVDMVRTAGADFWRLVETRTPPPLDGTDPTTAALKRRYADSINDVVYLDAAWLDRLDEREATREQIKALEGAVAKTANELRAAMGEHRTAVAGGLVVATWNPDKNDTRVLRVKDAAQRKPERTAA